MLDQELRYIPAECAGRLDERFCEAMDSAPVMIWVSGADKNCVWFNRAWLKFTGRGMAQELREGWTEGVHSEDYARRLEAYVDYFEARKEFRMEYRLRGHDGAYRWIEDRGIPRYARDGTFLGYVGSCVDISYLKDTEAALRERETRLRLATSSAKLGIYEQDIKNDRTVWANERMYEIFGRSVQDGPLSREAFYRDYLHPDDVRTLEAARTKAIETGGDLHISCRIRMKTGGERWVQIDGAYERSDSGEPLLLVGVAADITERKVLEQRAAELSERLVNVQEEERRRISQELHDSTTQHLVAAGLNIATLRPKSGLTPDDISRWDQTEACLEEAQKEIRTFSYLIHPPALEAHKLVAGMQQFMSGFSDRTGIEVEMRLDSKLDQLPFQMQRTFLRITQEALANVHHHAAASRVRVDGRIMADKVHLIVTDDGRGLETRNDAAVGRGIRGMQDRTSQWRGQLRIRSGSKGTRVHAMWPVPH
jgi:PAS domain S-box-containing protein